VNAREIKNKVTRRSVVYLAKDGLSVSAIAKELGLSYKYAKMIYDQEIDGAVSTGRSNTRTTGN
jgi:transposase